MSACLLCGCTRRRPEACQCLRTGRGPAPMPCMGHAGGGLPWRVLWRGLLREAV